MAKITKDIEDKLGKDKVEEIVEKEWKTAELPSEEELAKEEHTSSKARSNPNSRKNLIQYRKDTDKDTKKKVLKNLKYTHVEEDVDPSDIFGPGVDWSKFERVMPARDILVDRQEQLVYYNNLNEFAKDFEAAELTGSDVNDIITLATNQVLIFRLVKESKKHPKLLLECTNAVDKLRRQDEKIKQSLANRRVDRVDVKNKSAYSIVDLAAALDQEVEEEFQNRVDKLIKEDKDHKPYDPKI